MHACVYLCGLTKGFMAQSLLCTFNTVFYWTADTFDWSQICKRVTYTADTWREIRSGIDAGELVSRENQFLCLHAFFSCVSSQCCCYEIRGVLFWRCDPADPTEILVGSCEIYPSWSGWRSSLNVPLTLLFVPLFNKPDLLCRIQQLQQKHVFPPADSVFSSNLSVWPSYLLSVLDMVLLGLLCSIDTINSHHHWS